MPRLVSIRLALVCALAPLAALSFAGPAMAGPTPPHLRVVGKGGKVLAERSIAIPRRISVKTSHKANCLGAGTGGSGRYAKVRGATALGLLIKASKSTAALRPLS